MASFMYESIVNSIVDATRNHRSELGSMEVETAILRLSPWPRCHNAGRRCCLAQLGLHRGEKKHFLDIYEPSKAPNVSNGS